MPLANISAYIRNVVSGVRNSCVTDDTNAARRSLSDTAPINRNATAATPTADPTTAPPPHAAATDSLAGVQAKAVTNAGAGADRRIGSDASRKLLSSSSA